MGAEANILPGREQVKTARPQAPNKTWSVSREELERRWNLIRDHLLSRGLQALIVHGYEEKIGGYVRWLTDVPPGYPRFIIFHVDDMMTSIDHGPQGEYKRLDDNDPNRPGIGESVLNAALHGGNYTHGVIAESVVAVLSERGYTDVGLVGEGVMPHRFVTDLKSALGDRIRFTDETDAIDAIKSEKSPEEVEMIRRVAATQDDVFAKLVAWAKPGLRDFEINAFLDYHMQLAGADRGTYIGVSAPIGTPAPFNYRAQQGRTMGVGDHMNILIETNGLGGLWTELGRMISFGPLPDDVHEAHEVAVEAQTYVASLCVPGAVSADIFAKFNEFMVERGSAPEKRLFSHSQGYDMVERPFVRPDETMKMPACANLAIHPTYWRGNVFATLCDNFITGEGGGFIHSTPKRVYEL